MKLTQKQDDGFNRVLLFGPPKSGKTMLAGKLAEAGFNLTYIDMENGYKTLRQLSVEAQERINLISLPDTRSFPIAIETCLKIVKGGEHKICHKHGKVSCALCMKDSVPFEVVNLSALGPNDIVIWDSGTQLTNSALAHITKNLADDYKLQQDDWGNLGKLMDIFYSHVQNAPFNQVLITHETEAELEDGKVKVVPSAGSRNFARGVAKYFDTVIYSELKNKSHKFGSATSYAMNILTGSRTNIKLEDMKEASLESIFRSQADTAIDKVINLPIQKPISITNTSSQVPTPQVAQSSTADILARLKAGRK